MSPALKRAWVLGSPELGDWSITVETLSFNFLYTYLNEYLLLLFSMSLQLLFYKENNILGQSGPRTKKVVTKSLKIYCSYCWGSVSGRYQTEPTEHIEKYSLAH